MSEPRAKILPQLPKRSNKHPTTKKILKFMMGGGEGQVGAQKPFVSLKEAPKPTLCSLPTLYMLDISKYQPYHLP